MRVARCQICGVHLSRWALRFRNPARIAHYRNIHPDFVKWNGYFVGKLIASGLPLIVGIAFANYLLGSTVRTSALSLVDFHPLLLHRSSCVEARPGTVQTGLDEESPF